MPCYADLAERLAPVKSSDGYGRRIRSTWVGVWLSGAVLALSLFSFAGASAASAQTPARGLAAQTTCPTDPYTKATTMCNNGSTSDTAGVGDTGNVGAGQTGIPASGNGGALASTGADILMALLAAALLILLGTTLILAARQRRQAA